MSGVGAVVRENGYVVLRNVEEIEALRMWQIQYRDYSNFYSVIFGGCSWHPLV
jgi:hypothetical protein